MNKTLEKKRRLFHSIIWDAQKHYYDDKGLKAWAPEETPEFVSSNTYTGHYYARLIEALLDDLSPSSDSNSYIFDLGAGSGCFAYHCLKALDNSDVTQSLVYVLVDYSQKNIDAHLNNPQFKAWFDAGRCDVACIDLMKPINTITLQHSKKVLSPNNITQPLIAIANYLFCSLPVDYLELDDNHVRLAETTVTKPQKSKDHRRTSISLHYKRKLLDSDTPSATYFNHALFKDTDYPCRVAMPSAVFHVMDELQRFANGRLALLCSDVATDDPKKALTPRRISFRKKDGNLWTPLDLSTLHHWREQHGWSDIFFERCPHFFTAIFSKGLSLSNCPSLQALSQHKKAWLTPLAITQMLYSNKHTPCTLLKALDVFALDPHLLLREQKQLLCFTKELPYFKEQLKSLLLKHHTHLYFHDGITEKAYQVLGSLFYAVKEFKHATHAFKLAHLSCLDSTAYRQYREAQQITGQANTPGLTWRYLGSQLLAPVECVKAWWENRSIKPSQVYGAVTLATVAIFLFLHIR